MMTSGTSDEFFLPDESPIWWNDMPQPMYMHMVNNGQHSLAPRKIFAYEHFVSFVVANIERFELPQISWTVGSDETAGWINMTTNPAPDRVRAWLSDTLPEHDRRDYRRSAGYPDPEFQPVIWRQTSFDDLGDGIYRISVSYPEEGQYRAFFLEARWPGVDDRNIVFTTEVFIIPEELPFPPCEGVECQGTLV